MTAALSMPCMAPRVFAGAPFCAHATPCLPGAHINPQAMQPPRVSPYSESVGRALVVKVTAGDNDPERCNQAFTVAATAAASGVSVSLWLPGEAAWFALPGRAEMFS